MPVTVSRNSSDLVLRPAEASDEPFLRQVYAGTRDEELALTNWTAEQRAAFVAMQFAAQKQHYRTHFPDATDQVIYSGATPIGRLYVVRLADQLRILDLTILPGHCGKGYGTALLNGLMDEAARSGLPVRIHVESYARSHGLFERLGFAKRGAHGPYDLMEWRQ